jgi:hypothetical protein
MDNPEKLATQRNWQYSLYRRRQRKKNITQYVVNTTICKQTQINKKQTSVDTELCLVNCVCEFFSKYHETDFLVFCVVLLCVFTF